LEKFPGSTEYGDLARFVMAAKDSRFVESNNLGFSKVRLANKSLSSRKTENTQLTSQLSCLLGVAIN